MTRNECSNAMHDGRRVRWKKAPAEVFEIIGIQTHTVRIRSLEDDRDMRVDPGELYPYVEAPHT